MFIKNSLKQIFKYKQFSTSNFRYQDVKTERKGAFLGKHEEKVVPKKDIFAVVQIEGKQYKITVGDQLVVNRIKADVGSSIQLHKTLLVGGKDFTAIGRPIVSDCKVFATIEQHTHAKKVIVFKKKRRKGYRRWKGHEQLITTLRIDDIEFDSTTPKPQRVVAIE